MEEEKTINYIKGDATCPIAKGNRIIMHICNDLNKFGAGFALAIAKKWPTAKEAYHSWYREHNDFGLGNVRFCEVQPYIFVAHMIAQHGLRGGSKGPPIRYEALAECLQKVTEKAKELGASIHAPRIGIGLAEGVWSIISKLIEEHLCQEGVDVTIYDLE